MRLWIACCLALLAASLPATGAPPAGLPDTPFRDLDGQVRNLTEWGRGPAIVNFWASWCAPCQYEIPDLVRYQARYRNDGLRVVGIGLDEARPLRNVARTLGINYPVLLGDPGRHGRLLMRLGNGRQIVPFTVVVDREGDVVYRHVGRFGDEEFETHVLPLLVPATAGG